MGPLRGPSEAAEITARCESENPDRPPFARSSFSAIRSNDFDCGASLAISRIVESFENLASSNRCLPSGDNVTSKDGTREGWRGAGTASGEPRLAAAVSWRREVGGATRE